MRGIIPATVLQYVEDQIIKKTGNPNARIADYFDFIAGTSTGGILTAFYLTPNLKAGENDPKSKYNEVDDFFKTPLKNSKEIDDTYTRLD